MRIGSALALDIEDVDLDRGEIRLRKMKAGHSATVFVPAAWTAVLRAHLAGITEGAVFRSWSGIRLSQRHAQRRLSAWCKTAGLPRTYSPYAFRHAFAMRVYEQCRDIGVVQAAPAHRPIASTMVYARASAGQVRAAVGAT